MARLPALLALLALAAVAAAGCAGPGGGGGGGSGGSSTSSSSSSQSATGTPAPEMPRPPTVVDLLPDFALGPCEAVSVRSAQPIAAVQALLPPGFVATPFGTDDTGVVAVDFYACGNLTTPHVSIADTVYGQVYTLVQRPELPGLPAPDGAGVVHEYVFRVLAGQDVLSALWPAAGYDMRNGTASVAVEAPPGLPVDAGLRTGMASVGEGDAYRAIADGHASAPAPAGPAWPGAFARYTLLPDGSVLLWTGTYEVPAPFAGQGSFGVAGDDALAAFEAGDHVPGLARLAEAASMTGLRLQRVFP